MITMSSIVLSKNEYRKSLLLIVLMLVAFVSSQAQKVENRSCPNSYFRNNGNGQSVTVFAANISPASIYAQTALTSGNQGNFTFKWDVNIVNPPVIKKTWVTSTSGVTTQNWIFGNNNTGSPFNPPGVPENGDVKYTFYNSNLPTAGVVTLELMDPIDGSYVNTCSYPLTSGSSSTSSIVSLAVEAPSNFSYFVSSATSLKGVSGSSVDPNIKAAGGTITYTLMTPVNGVSVNATKGTISWNGNTDTGTHLLSIKASNGILPDAVTNYTLIIAQTGVTSGTDGGLESKSLGNAVAERLFNKTIQNIPANIDYGAIPKKANETNGQQQTRLQRLMPDQQILGNTVASYVTSPLDILSFTNAVDVLSMDYVEGGLNKAVAFCTKTMSGIYTHTKPVCDRLKGSELLAVETIQHQNLSFLRYQLQPTTGLKEYAVSFSAGFNKNAKKIILQSEWTTDRYSSQDTMYNFQLWSVDSIALKLMLQNVLEKLATIQQVEQEGSISQPIIYISKANRDIKDQYNLELVIKNNTSATVGTIHISGKQNEQSTNTISKMYPISFLPNGTTTVSIPLTDMAETELKLLVNGKQEDFVYNNDGIWNIYKTGNTNISEFTVTNDTIKAKSNEYRLFRNIKLKASTSDYVTVYRILKGGGAPLDLSKLNTLRFTASGGGTVRIRLIKKSITDYANQYEHKIILGESEKEYIIPISDFTSQGYKNEVTLNDLTILSFTYEANNTAILLNSAIKNVKFTSEIKNNLSSTENIKIFPNPVSTATMVQFNSSFTETMNLQLFHLGSGQQVFQKTIPVGTGLNNYHLQMPQPLASGTYIIHLSSPKQRMQVKLLKK
jgi:hypothetical protein